METSLCVYGKANVSICSCTLRQVDTLPHGKFAESTKFSEASKKQTQSSFLPRIFLRTRGNGKMIEGQIGRIKNGKKKESESR